MMKKRFVISVIAFVLLFNFFLGFQRLSRFSAVDEPYWTYDRTPKFWKAVSEMKWKNTKINDKPGITVAILSGIGLLEVDPMPYKSFRGDPKTPQQMEDIKKINLFLRLPIFIFTLLSLPLFYFFLKKLFDSKTALLGFLLIGLSPLLFGISLIINPDSLLWIFFNFSILTYLIYRKSEDKKYLCLAGVFLGLSLLTKYVANILYIFFFFLPFLEYVFAENKPPLREYLKKTLLDFLILVFFSLLIFFLLFPATWKKPELLLEGTFLSAAFKSTWPLFAGLVGFIALDIFLLKSRITYWLLDFVSLRKHWLVKFLLFGALLSVFFVFLNTYLGMKFFDFIAILSSPKGTTINLSIFVGKIMADVYSLIFGVSPFVLLGALFFLGTILKKKHYDQEAKISFYFVILIFLYYLASTVNSVVATVRYQIVLYPLFLIIGAFGLKIFFESKILRFVPQAVLYLLLITILAFSFIQMKPFYFTYASGLLPQKYDVNLKDMGDGSYEAAEYLNQKANAENLFIWSDKGAVCESFVGKCNIGFSKKDLANINFDYFVISSGRKSRSLKLSGGINEINFREFYTVSKGEYEIYFDNRTENFVKVIKNPNK
jgi:hypothetical protein